MTIRVLVVDDSISARAIIKELLLSEPRIGEVLTASDAFKARDIIVQYRPDVICLDVNMPRMDGITFLKKMMLYLPTPVVMVSSYTSRGAKTTLDALTAGAVDFVAKPSHLEKNFDSIRLELVDKVLNAATANLKAQQPAQGKPLPSTLPQCDMNYRLIAMGASTGGTEALKNILSRIPAHFPGIVIVQHMPPEFTPQFAERLNANSIIEVREARSGDRLTTGLALLAPGDKHMVVRKGLQGYSIELGGGKKVSGHRPSVNVLFNSVSKVAGKHACGVILTGMGDDGASGLLNMKKAGALTIGQDETSSMVYGMPKSAWQLGAVTMQVSLNDIPETLSTMLSQKNAQRNGAGE